MTAMQRFREILKVFVSYGFGYLIDSKIKKDEKSPEKLKKVFEELGPTFVKIGQILSTRPDLMPQNYIVELSKLQDNVAPVDFKEINEVFKAETGKYVEEVFEYFNPKPVACASIAQVYEARLKSGREVIVKIQRPGIEQTIKLDTSILYRMIKFVKNRLSDLMIDPLEALQEIKQSLLIELDFYYEARNIQRFKKLNKDIKYVTCPNVVWSLTTKRVLTMEKVKGFKINDVRRLKREGYDLEDVAKKLAMSYFKQIFEDGFFHGDPHPGNLLIREGQICFIDFGIMGEITESFKETINEMIIAVAYQDANKLVSILMSIGTKKGKIDRNKLFEDIEYLFMSYLSTSLHNIQISALLSDIFDTAKNNSIRLPKDFTLLIRSLVIIEGVVLKISPEIKIIDIIIDYVSKSKEYKNIFKDIDVDKLMIGSLAFLKDGIKIPTKFVELVDAIMVGRAKVQLEHKSLDHPLNELNKAINRLIMGIVIAAMIIGSSFILGNNIGPKYSDVSLIGMSGYLLAALIGGWLLISIIKSGRL